MLSKLLPSGLAIGFLVGVGLLMANPGTTPPTVVPTAVNGIPVVPHVIYISCDALRGDTLATIIANRPAQFPNFKKLKDEGAATFNARTDFGFTETIPNHSTMITGRPVYEPGTSTQLGDQWNGRCRDRCGW